MKNIKIFITGLLLTLACCHPALAWNSTTIMNNGPSSEKLDIVFLGDGYTADQMALYASDVKTFTDYLFSIDGPFKDYKNLFNVHRVDVISNQSGVDNTCEGIDVDNALDSAYYQTAENDCRALFTYSGSKVYDAAASAPAADKIIVITNSEMYGGAAYLGGYGVFYHGANGPEVMAHELGHALGYLADEYYYSATRYSGSEPFSPNVTINTDRTTLKWGRWVYPDVPLPTTGTVNDLAGLYEGAQYNAFGIYRPTYASKMQYLYRPYERVNYAALLDQIFSFVPGDTSGPNVQLAPDICGAFTSQPEIQWTLTADDPESNVFAYRASFHDDFADTAWDTANNQPTFTKVLDIVLPPEDGLKTFHYEVQNGYKLITSASCEITFDTVAPSVPGQPNAPSPNNGTFTLSWAESTDELSGVSHYEIYRSNDGGQNFSLVNLSNGPSYAENSLAVGSYVYRVQAKDRAGNDSGFSANSATIVVTKNQGNVVTLSADPDVVKVGGNLKISWTNSASRQNSQYDSIRLYKVGGNKLFFTGYTEGKKNGNFKLDAPANEGTYEFRYFSYLKQDVVAVSNPVTVKKKR